MASGIDEAGQIPPSARVEPNGPDVLESTLWPKSDFESSRDAGSFLCNFFSIRLCASGRIPAVFIHLPIQGEISDREYKKRHSPIAQRLLDSI